MYHTFLVVTVKRWLKSVYIYGSYHKTKTGVPFFWDHPVYYAKLSTYRPFKVIQGHLLWRQITGRMGFPISHTIVTFGPILYSF